MSDATIEIHDCPMCQQRTRHQVSRERKLAPVMWCMSCFHVHVENPDEAKMAPRKKAKAA